MKAIKGILIDSGRVLNVPVTGNWSYSPNFFEIVGKEKYYNISKSKRKAAYKKAWDYINSIEVMATIEDEKEHFAYFFSIIALELPELKINDEKRNLLIEDFVFNFDKYIFFKDVVDLLPKLSKEYKLCVVSDAWPSLRYVYRKANLESYFDSIVISSEIGATKPNEQIYKAALQKLKLNENEVIFIDDNPKNCDGALKLGIESIILERKFLSRAYSRFILKTPYEIAKNLYEVKKIVAKLRNGIDNSKDSNS